MRTVAQRRVKGDKAMGRFSVEFQVANNEDMADARRGRIKPEAVRRATLSGVVDPGATRLVLAVTKASASWNVIISMAWRAGVSSSWLPDQRRDRYFPRPRLPESARRLAAQR